MITEIIEIVVRERGAASTSSSIRAIGTAARTANTGVRILLAGLGALGAGVSARGIIEGVDSFIRLNNAITAISSSGEEAAAIFERIRQISNETRAPIETTAELFRRFSVATRTLGVSQNEVIDVVRGLNQAIAASGTTAREGAAGLIQLGQGLASGRFQGDELRSVLENLPPIAIALADSLGVTIGQLRELGRQGALTPDQVFRGLQRALPTFEAAFRGLTPTIESVFTVLQNELTVAVGRIDRIIGGSKELTGSLFDLAKSAGPALVNVVATILDGFGNILRTGSDVIRLLRQLGVETLDFGNILEGVLGAFSLFLSSLSTGINFLIAAMTSFNAILVRANVAVGVQTQEEFAAAVEKVVAAEDQLIASSKNLNKEFGDYVDRLGKAEGDTKELSDDFLLAADNADVLAARLRAANLEVKTNQDLLNKPGVDRTGADTKAAAELAAEQEKAAKALANLLNQIEVKEASRISQINKQLAVLGNQRDRLIELNGLTGDLTSANEGLLRIGLLIRDLQAERNALIKEEVDATLEVEANLAVVERTNAPVAQQFREQAEAILESNIPLEEKIRLLQQLNSEIDRQAQLEAQATAEVASRIAEPISTVVGGALRSVLQGEAINFGELLGAAAERSLGQAFDDLIGELSTSLAETLRSTFQGIDAGSLGTALSAGLGLGSAILSGALRDDEQTTRNNLVRSAVESSTPIRGVVVGPTEIPIFQVGESIEDAFGTTNDILRQILAAIQGTAGAPSLPSGGIDPTSELGRTTTSLV